MFVSRSRDAWWAKKAHQSALARQVWGAHRLGNPANPLLRFAPPSMQPIVLQASSVPFRPPSKLEKIRDTRRVGRSYVPVTKNHISHVDSHQAETQLPVFAEEEARFRSGLGLHMTRFR